MKIANTRKFGVLLKIFLLSKTVRDYGNRSASICRALQEVGKAVVIYLFMLILRALWTGRSAESLILAGPGAGGAEQQLTVATSILFNDIELE